MKAMKKGMKKAMKKGKAKAKAKPVEGEGGEVVPASPRKVPKLSTRKQILEEIGDMPLEQALKVYKQKKVDAEKAVEVAVKEEAGAVKEAERLKVLSDKAGAQVEALLQKNKDKRSKGSEAKVHLLDLEKEIAILKKAENMAQQEVQMLEEEAEGEEKRRELRAAKEKAKKATEEAKEASRKEKEAIKEAQQREKEAAMKAKNEEQEARRQAKDMQELAKEKAKEHKRQEAEERKRSRQEAIAAKTGGGRGSAPKRVKMVHGEDVD